MVRRKNGPVYERPEDEYMERLERQQAQRNLLPFMKQAWHLLEPANPYVDNWHIGCIAEHLEAVTSGEIRNIIINIPPRHMKSLAISVFWFCWVWVRDPSSRWLFSSYAENLSTRDSMKCRDVIKSSWYQRRWNHVFRMRADKDTQAHFENNRHGYRIATTVAGKVLGQGGDYIVADDPHKREEIRSKVARRNVIDWWTQTISTRGNNPKTVRKVIVMQRLHEGDLSGYVLNNELGYEHLCLPCMYEPKRYYFPPVEPIAPKTAPVEPGGPIASPAAAQPSPGKMSPEAALEALKAKLNRAMSGRNDPKGGKPRDAIVPTKLQRRIPRLRDNRTEPGELLFKDRFGPEEVADLKRELTGYGVAGQLQQRPAPSDGDVFTSDSFRPFREEKDAEHPDDVNHNTFVLTPPVGDEIRIPRRLCRFYQTCDTALKETVDAKYTAVVTAVTAPVMEGGQVVGRHLLIYDVWRDKLTVPKQFAALMAIRARYPVMFQAVEEAASGTGLIQQGIAEGKPFLPLSASYGDKVQRASTVATMYEAGIVWHRSGMPNLSDYEDELLKFPSGEFSDWTDCTAYAGLLFTQQKILWSGLEGPLVASPTAEDEKRAQEYDGSVETVTIPGVGEVTFYDDD